ncbi:MAG TPA: hypothetical protein VM580_09410, partial [Labilithrix sp.]|nr:hypothetical protein [Labilithrix sp.]
MLVVGRRWGFLAGRQNRLELGCQLLGLLGAFARVVRHRFDRVEGCRHLANHLVAFCGFLLVGLVDAGVLLVLRRLPLQLLATLPHLVELCRLHGEVSRAFRLGRGGLFDGRFQRTVALLLFVLVPRGTQDDRGTGSWTQMQLNDDRLPGGPG